MSHAYYNLKDSAENVILRNGRSISFEIDGGNIDTDASHRLLFSCEDSAAPILKHESGAELLYMLIDDSLNYEKAEENRYCLDLSSEKPLPFAKRALKKLVWQPITYGLFAYTWFEKECCTTWKCGVYAKAENLKIEPNGYVHLRTDVWDVKEGVSPNCTIAPPDKTIITDISEGTYDYTCFEQTLNLEKETTACVVVTIEGEGYSGNLYFERPYLRDDKGRNLLFEFDRAAIGVERTAWVGQNLSKREWPHIQICINGEKCFDDEVFLKIHRFSPIEIDLPAHCFNDGKNTISIAYKSDYIDAIPLVIDEAHIIETPNSQFRLIRCPDEVPLEKEISLLVETNNTCDKIEFVSDDFTLCETSDFEKVNLKVFSIKTNKKKNNLQFTLKTPTYQKTFTVKRCVIKKEDNVLSGSGDMVYIDISNINSVIDYIKWYVENDIGDMLTVRPVYRWGGQRSVNPKVWEIFTALCDKLGISYVHISDGRDIPGIAANPTLEMMSGKNFLGRQLHERDGQLFYWSRTTGHPVEINAPKEEFYDLVARLARETPDKVEGSFRSFNIEYSEAGYSFRRHFPKNRDAAEVKSIVDTELSLLSGDSFSRHTGPSVMFKYFLENGFDWCGAETMDGSTEILLSFLRGASCAYNKVKSGVHLALQWSTFPHDTIQRYRRYLLSLYIPYMHGVTDINTEEGLWFMESFLSHFNRISQVCHMHRKQLNKFNTFVRTHTRSGKFYSPISFVHGNMDGWNGYNSPIEWGIPNIPLGDAGASWQILKNFYPLDAIVDYGCTKVNPVYRDNDKPYGLFSGTPSGCVDVVPAEIGDFSIYKALIFAGYNMATPQIMDRIEKYLKNGGTVLCAWPHFSDTTFYDDILDYKLNIVRHSITEALSGGDISFIEDTIDGKKIIVSQNTPKDCEVIEKTDSEIPLVYRINYAGGTIIFVNTLYYPGNEVVLPIYNRAVKLVSDTIKSTQSIDVECGNDVQYTTFLQDDGTIHYYFTAVDWYNDSPQCRTAYISFDGNTYKLDIPFGEIIKLVTNGKTAVWPKNSDAEVISLTAETFEAQGYGCQSFFVANGGKLCEQSFDFDDNTIQISGAIK